MNEVSTWGSVIANRSIGDYQRLTIAVEGIANSAYPGQFVALAIGGADSSMLLRRVFSLYKVALDGPYGPTVDIVVAAQGPGSTWIAGLPIGADVAIAGPLGTPFPLPKDETNTVLVGGGYGSAPLFWLAEALARRGCGIEMVLGAGSAARLFGVDQAQIQLGRVTVTTDDGSAGQRGRVTDVLGPIIERTRASLVYACGPMGMLRAVADVAHDANITSLVTVEEAMACGVGVCMTCVLPVVGDDGVTTMARSCVDGPTFRGDRVRWDALDSRGARVPADALGAPSGTGH